VKIGSLSLLILFPATLAAQSGGVTGVIVVKGTGEPLSYGIVGVDNDDRNTFTSDSGRFTFRDLKPGKHMLRARRLGYSPKDLAFEVRAGIVDSLHIEMDRVAVTLGRIDVKAYPPCTKPGPEYADSTLKAIVEQIRLNAEQFRFMSAEYPFEYVALIKRSVKLREDGRVVRADGSIESISSRNQRAYHPGGIVFRKNGTWFFHLPELSNVADPLFLAAHCWHYGGIDTIADEPVYRVDVVADDSLKGEDVNGSFYISQHSFQIRRSVFHPNRQPRQFKELMDMEVTVDFFEVMESISIPEHVNSVQVIDPGAKSQFSHVYEEHETSKFKWLKRKPGEVQPAKKP